jgi:GMP synthase (glutamine-hydrolysing)
VYSEVVPHTTPVTELLKANPSAIILSGGPSSVYAEGAPGIDPALLEAGVPVFGICYGFQAIAQALGGTVEHTGAREFGRTELTARGGVLHEDLPGRHPVWMSHGDSVTGAPNGFTVTAASAGAPVAGFEDVGRRIAGVQYHPEVAHSPHGQEVLRRFLHDIAGIRPLWTTASIVDEQVAGIKEQIGTGRAICGLSGGVDSAVAAALVQKAIGDRLTCVFVDHGLLRAGERAQVERDFVSATGVNLVTVDAADRFLNALNGVTDPEEKRKIIGREFIRVFEQAELDLQNEAGTHGERFDFLVQGTLYPDVVESGGRRTATIKSHHNVGGLPDDMRMELVEPLRLLFKDEVRRVGAELGLPEDVVRRQPFPGPGLAVRIVGEVTPERLETLRAADRILLEELRRAGLDRELWQYFAVLPAVRTVGVMGDGRTYAYPIVVRAVTSEDAMTADFARLPWEVLERIATRVVGEVAGVNRVAYDVTSKPPGTIEWE